MENDLYYESEQPGEAFPGDDACEPSPDDALVENRIEQPGAEDAPQPKAALAMNAYSIVEAAVERGLGWGWLHAHKHLDDGTHPTEERMVQHMLDDVMNELCEAIDFDKSGVAACAVDEKWPAPVIAAGDAFQTRHPDLDDDGEYDCPRRGPVMWGAGVSDAAR